MNGGGAGAMRRRRRRLVRVCMRYSLSTGHEALAIELRPED